jgi:hypothetical protein
MPATKQSGSFSQGSLLYTREDLRNLGYQYTGKIVDIDRDGIPHPACHRSLRKIDHVALDTTTGNIIVVVANLQTHLQEGVAADLRKYLCEGFILLDISSDADVADQVRVYIGPTLGTWTGFLDIENTNAADQGTSSVQGAHFLLPMPAVFGTQRLVFDFLDWAGGETHRATAWLLWWKYTAELGDPEYIAASS